MKLKCEVNQRSIGNRSKNEYIIKSRIRNHTCSAMKNSLQIEKKSCNKIPFPIHKVSVSQFKQCYLKITIKNVISRK